MAQPLDPPLADVAPNAETLTPYDEEHLVTYLRLLDADTQGADWTDVASLVLHIDPAREPARAPCLGKSFGTRQMDDRTRLFAKFCAAVPQNDLRNRACMALMQRVLLCREMT